MSYPFGNSRHYAPEQRFGGPLAANGFGSAEAPAAPLDFDTSLALEIEARTTAANRHLASVTAEEEYVSARAGALVGHLIEREMIRRRDAMGEGTPLDKMPFSKETKAYVRRFLELAEEAGYAEGPWEFFTWVQVEPEPAPEPEPTPQPALAQPEPMTVKTWWGGQRVVLGQPEPAPEAVQPEPVVPEEDPAPEFRRHIRKTLVGFDVGAYCMKDVVTIRLGPDRELWVGGLQNPPDGLVMDMDGVFYCLPMGINESRSIMGYCLEDRLPKTVPQPRGNDRPFEFGAFGRVGKMPVQYDGRPHLFPYAVFRRTPGDIDQLIRHRLKDIAADAGFTPAIPTVREEQAPAADAQPVPEETAEEIQ